MLIDFRCGLTKEEILKLSTTLKQELPQDYQDFLEQRNGCYIHDSYNVKIPFKGVDAGYLTFDFFFGMLNDNSFYDIISFNEEFIHEIEHTKAIAIGDNGYGNTYLIINSSGRGGIYYCDRMNIHNNREFNRLYYIANNFSNFYNLIINNLKIS